MNRILSTLLLVGLTGQALATEIVRWVDDAGVTHFSQPHLAQGPASVVEVQPANGMAVPDASSVPTQQRGPQFHKISKAEKKNKDGWTGYQRQDRTSRRYRR